MRASAWCCGLLLAGLAATATAQSPDNYPTKPIRIVLPFGAPGGASDIVARFISTRLSETFGQQVLFDPRNGAGGIMGTEIAARSAPDGYTFLITGPSHAINLALYSKLPYDTLNDFTPVSLVYEVANILVVHPSVPARNVKELIAHARANPGKLTYGSAGNGSMSHLGGEMFTALTGTDIAHIPYKGTGPAITDLLGGQVQMLFAGGISITPQVKSGRVRILAQTTATRSRLLPNVPTLAEAGIPGFELNGWYAWLAPAGTPPAIVQALNREAAHILQAPDMLDKFANDGSEPAPGSSEDLRALYNREIEKWARLFARMKVKL